MGCGLFTDDMIAGFQKLVTRPDLDAKAARELIDAIPVGGAERYLVSVNELMKADHAFKDAGTLRRLVDHPGMQTLLIEEKGSAFAGLMGATGGDLARAERRLGSLEILKRRAYAIGGEGEYERLLAKLGAGDLAAADSLRQGRRVQELAYNLEHDVQDLVFDALRANDRAAFDAARANLRKRLMVVGSPDQVARFERSMLTAWRVERLELSGATHGLSTAERLVLEDMTVEQWNSIFYHAERRGGWYSKDASAAVYNVKGLMAEEVFYASPDFQAALTRARQVAAQRGLDPSSVRLVRSVRGKTVSELTERAAGAGELTDGVLVANPWRQEGGQIARDLNGFPVRDYEEMHVLTVMESKSPSNVGQLAGDKPGAKLPKKWIPEETLPFEANYFGQMSEDFERFSELPTRFGQEWFPPDRVRISRNWTEWIAVHPPGHPIPAGVAERLFGKTATATETGQSPLFNRILRSEGLVRDEVLNKVAESVFSAIKL
jgi:hypothetical protein